MKIAPILIAFSALATTTKAQHNLAIATGNWSAINSVFLNPANIADCREKKAVSVAALSFYVDNNVGPFNISEGLVVAVGDGKTNNMFSYTNNSKISMTAPYVNIIGPGAVKRINKNNSIAFTSRLRGMNQFTNFDQTIFHTFNDPYYKPEENILSKPRDFAYTLNLWAEFGFSYGGVVYNKDRHKIKVGATVRYLAGIAYVGVKGRKMDTRFTQGNDTFFAANTDIEYGSNVLNTLSLQGNDIGKNFKNLVQDGNFGHGIGADLGVVYEMKAIDSKPQDGYLAKFSLSVCDIGAITYSSRVNTNEVISGDGYVTGQGILDNVKNFQNLKNYATQRGLTAEIRKKQAKANMPLHMVMGGDYHLKDKYYLNATFIFNLANRKAIGNSYYNQFTITPRYETKNLTIGVPLTFSPLSNRLKAGAGIYYRNFFIGSDDMLAFAIKGQYGVNVYAGITKRFYK